MVFSEPRKVLTELLAYCARGLMDLVEGATNWRIWYLIGAAELRQRYARSSLGQFWLTLSTALSTLILGLVWSVLWNIQLSQFLPYIAVSIILWQLMSAILTESGSLLASNRHILLSQRLPCSTLIYAMLFKHLLSFAHNTVTILAVLIWFRLGLKPSILLLPVGLVLLAVAAVWSSYLLAIICTRYRDLNHAVQSAAQLIFYVTPILWKPDFLSEQYRAYLILNPFHDFMTILRSSILGEPFPSQEWAMCVLFAVGGYLVALPIIGRYCRRILYWI